MNTSSSELRNKSHSSRRKEGRSFYPLLINEATGLHLTECGRSFVKSVKNSDARGTVAEIKRKSEEVSEEEEAERRKHNRSLSSGAVDEHMTRGQ